MPGLDRKGPLFGNGNQSGRKMGKCNPDHKDNESFETEKNIGKEWRKYFEEESEISKFRGKGMGRRNKRGNGESLGRRKAWRQNQTND